MKFTFGEADRKESRKRESPSRDIPTTYYSYIQTLTIFDNGHLIVREHLRMNTPCKPMIRVKVKILEQVSSSEKLTNFCNFMSRGGKSLKIQIIKKLQSCQSALMAEMI